MWFRRVASQPGGPVDPIPIEGAFGAFHSNMSAYRGRLVEAQDALAVAETYSSIHLVPVAMIAPFPAPAGVAVSGPAYELVVEYVVDELEASLGDTVLVVVGPALDDRVEHVDWGCLWRTAMLANHLAHSVAVAL